MAKIGFIGMGNMGTAMLKGLLQVYDREQIIFTSAHKEKMERVSRETGVAHADSNTECAENCEYLVLAVKPQYYEPVLHEIAAAVKDRHIIISIAPGLTIDWLKEILGMDKRIVRAMPNTPALVGEGMTGVCYDPGLFCQEEQDTIAQLFGSFGRMKVVPEHLIDAVVCASGSSPAYVYLFIEALADGAVKHGLPRRDAYELAAQAVLGSARMVLETGMHPGALKDNVCSPGGTTIAGVAALEEYGFRNAILKASDACYDQCGKIK